MTSLTSQCFQLWAVSCCTEPDTSVPRCPFPSPSGFDAEEYLLYTCLQVSYMILRGYRSIQIQFRKGITPTNGTSYLYPSPPFEPKSRLPCSRVILNLKAPCTRTNRSIFSHTCSRPPVQSSLTPHILAVLLLCFGTYIYKVYSPEQDTVDLEDNSSPVISHGTESGRKGLDFSAMPVQPGYRGNLTAEQEKKLRDLWIVALKVFGIEDHNQPDGAIETPDTASEADVALSNREKKRGKKRGSLFKRKDKDKDSNDIISTGTPEDKYGQVKEFHDVLETTPAESLRKAFWGMVKADHPDALLLRFLRARKWDVDRALVMLISTMKWRASEMHVDDDIIKHGEGGALEDSKSTDSATKKEGDDFLAQLRMGKSFLHGIDKQGRPLCIVRVRLHRQGEQSERSLEKYTVFVIETARLLLKRPVETAVCHRPFLPIIC